MISKSASQKRILSLVLIVSALTSAAGFAEVKPTADADLTMNRELHKDVHQALYFLQGAHYQPSTLNDQSSSNILDNYLEILDPNKLYFTASDINSLDRVRFKLDDILKRRDAEIAFDLFKSFRARVDARNQKLDGLIDRKFDYELSESLLVDRDSIAWASSEQELEDRWRKKIKADMLQQFLSDTEAEEARSNLKRRYQRQRDVVFQLGSDDVFEWFMNAYTKEFGPHTQYMSHATAENFRIGMSLSLQGIGAELRSEDDYTVINRTIAGGPAEASGVIDAEDKIVGVAQAGEEMIDVIGWRLRDVVKMIRGDKGTKVTLNIIDGDNPPGSTPERIEIVRDVIKLEDRAAKLSYIDLKEGNEDYKYGVISIPSFYSSNGKPTSDSSYAATTYDVEKLLKKMEGEDTDGLVIDLRGNGGGYLTEAISLTGLFIDQGPVVQVIDSKRKRQILRDTDSNIQYGGPLVVLIDRFSASASEIFAAAIQDYGRGIIVGERSFGKGTVQRLSPLRYGDYVTHESQIKFTTAQFFRINGDSTQHNGVMPDVVLNSGRNDEDFGERSLDNALPSSTTQSTKYMAETIPNELLAELQNKHIVRSNQSSAFKYLQQNSARVEENRDRKSVSLNMAQREQELESQETTSLSQLNSYRASLGLESVTADTREDNPLPDEDEHWNIVFQQEAARVLKDKSTWDRSLVSKNENSL
ncbi:MAG: carboxy terminal-processing peptidase, partial [Pseudomonadota bacterium]